MIKIIKKENCCGCFACMQSCPNNCISVKEDKEGFLYPQVNYRECINCNICEKVCPIIQNKKKQKPKLIYAAKNKNEQTRTKSSSGGIFTVIAEKIIDMNGIVFGARFDEQWNVIHDYTDSKEKLSLFRGAKYSQSSIGYSYKNAEKYLKEGKYVLFSGTPCQISGLLFFLNKEYPKLTTVEIICHGVPSPKIWKWYKNKLLNNIIKRNVDRTNNSSGKFIDIQFRNKVSGWKNYSFFTTSKMKDKKILYIENSKQNIFMRGFLSDLYLRPSCYSCSFKAFNSGSDITIGDYWGIEYVLPQFDDDKGVSLVMINTNKGHDFIDSENLHLKETTYEQAFQYSIENSPAKPIERTFFFRFVSETNIIKCISKVIRLIYLKKRIKHIFLRSTNLTKSK